MALKPEVERLLAKITDVGQRAEAAKLYEAHPFMQEAVLAQEDYSRKIQEVDRKGKAADAKYNSNVDWFQKESVKVADIESDRDRLIQESETMKVELEALRGSRGEAGATGADLSKYDAKIALLEKAVSDSKADLLTKSAYEKDLKDRADNVVAFTFEVMEAKERHLKEFGVPLAKDDLFNFMNEKKIKGVDEAYEKLTAERRQQSWETNKEKEIEDRIMAKLSALKLPMGDGSTGPVRGPLQQWIAKEVPVPDGITADGSGRLGSIAAQELRAEGKI